MAEALLRAELIENIPELQDDEAALDECVSICKNFEKSGTDFRFDWEAMRFKSGTTARDSQVKLFTLEDAKAIKADLFSKLRQKEIATKNQQIKADAKRASFMSAMTRRSGPSTSTPTKPTRIAVSGSSPSTTARVVFKRPPEDLKKRKFRYMYEKISERSEILDERIDEVAEMIRDHYNVDDLGDPSATSEEDVVVVGRICNDAEATSSKLSEDSIMLESSRMSGAGKRVPLRFSHSPKLRGMPQGIGSVGLFPGAIVALKGRNGGGNAFVVNEILGLPLLRPSPEPNIHKAFTMAIACGPYTSDSSLDFRQFKLFMEKVALSKPSVLLLLGPFVDANHPMIKNGDIDEDPGRIFESRIGLPAAQFCKESPDSLVLLSPSVRDILSDHPVYPQSSLDALFDDPRIRMLPNPSKFSINGVSFCTTSVDVLFHLKNQEYSVKGAEVDPTPSTSSGSDIFINACRHLLSQRSIYPLFPVPQDLSSEVNLDVTHSDSLRLQNGPEEYSPDILIVPSKFKQFAKDVDGTWAINPSFLTKATYAFINVPDTGHDGLSQVLGCEIVKL